MLLMPDVMRVLAPGFERSPEKYDLAVQFSTITFPYLALISVTALQTGVLNAQGRFGPGAAAPIAFNLVLIAGLFLARFLHLDVGYTLAWSVTISGVVQLLWLMVSCYRAGVSIPLLKPHLGDASRRLFRRIGPGAIGAGAAQVNLLISTILASTLPTGAVSYLFYADRLNQLPLGIVGIAVATTLLPLLSRHIEAGRLDHAQHYMGRAIEFCLMLGLPATIGLALAAQPIIQTLFEHGKFTHEDTIQTAETLAAYAFGIPAFLLVKAFAAGFFARHDTATPVKVALIAMTVNVVASVLLLGLLKHTGIALANSLAVWTNAILLYGMLRKKIGVIGDAKLSKRFPRLLISAFGMSAATWYLVNASTEQFTGHDLMREGLALGGIIVASSAFYALFLQLTGAINIGELARIIKRKPVPIEVVEDIEDIQ
jgi:putative peptidoglycan lipid II flippase